MENLETLNELYLLSPTLYLEYRVTHKESHCKDDPKLLTFDNLKLDFLFLPFQFCFLTVYEMSVLRKLPILHGLQSAWNPKFKKRD